MNSSRDPRFPWIKFPANAKVGDIWRARGKVMPTWATWIFQGDGWSMIDNG
jgi:hypothetical protein